jgi:hypothetical protein
MITIDNYFDEINKIDLSTLTEALKKSHNYVLKITNEGESWDKYNSSEAIKKMVDIYLLKLNGLIQKEKVPSKQRKKEEAPAEGKKEDSSEKKVGKKKAQKSSKEIIQTSPVVTMVERMPDELKIIKRFVNMDGKWKTKDEILRFINSLQKAILEKRIRKVSIWAEQILFIQDKLISVYNSMKQKIKIELKPETLEQFRLIAGEEKVLASINFIKRYISLNGKSDVKEKAKNLLEQINRAMDKGKITDNDPYINEIHELKKNLKSFTSSKEKDILEIEKAELNGLENILGCACQQLNGLDTVPTIMNSMDFAQLEFDTIGLQGKWLDLIGDPSRNFTAMVFGKPKMGKSYLCVEFAGYLARHHGKVLYVAKEEGLDLTLQNKLNEKNVKHPNLYVASVLPTNLSIYDFIFLDSVSKLGLEPDDLNRLKAAYPGKSFIFIFQSTKDGKFRGANTFQHDVDVVIEVPEKGKAVQMGRFNQGGEIQIFQNRIAA